jgi:ribosomal protein L13E
MEKITLEQAKVVADKVNALIQSSYVEGTTFTVEDVTNAGLSFKQAKRVLGGFVRSKILYLFEDKYYAHPDTLKKLKEKDERTTI